MPGVPSLVLFPHVASLFMLFGVTLLSSFLGVSPIQVHWMVLFHSSSFEILSGHLFQVNVFVYEGLPVLLEFPGILECSCYNNSGFDGFIRFSISGGSRNL